MESKFIIKQHKLVGKIGEKLEADTICLICRNNLEENSIYVESLINNKLSTGTCEHVFHYECIRRWVSSNIRCPKCFNKWQYK